jgi:peptidoglycan-N-acetylglucosamine deacetylase
LYVATGVNFPDALAGGAAAAVAQAPVLLVGTDHVPDLVAAELRRLKPREVRVLGGAAAVSDAVLAELGGLTGTTPRRLAGPDRYATAAAVVQDAFPGTVDTVYVATGVNFPDALAGGAAAAVAQAPVLLVGTDHVPDGVRTELVRLLPR